MKLFFDNRQAAHAPTREFHNGGWTSYAETPALHRTDADAAEIAAAAAAAAMRTARDIDDIPRNNIVPHQTIARESGNMLFHQIIRSFVPLMTVAVPLAWRTRETPQAREEVLTRYHQIGQVIADRDANAAAKLMVDHLDVSIGSVL